MAPKKTNSQKARERRQAADPQARSTHSSTAHATAKSQELEIVAATPRSRKRLTVAVLIIVGLLFTAAMFGAERLLRDDDSDVTPTVEAAAGVISDTDASASPVALAIVRDAELSARCWPNGGPVPGNDVSAASPPSPALDSAVTYTARINTNYGSFTFQFYPEEAPNTVNNFICLANEGYYDNTLFHRVIDGFMFQGGDPLGNGTGGPGYRFADEPVVRDYITGTLAMANAGPDTQGSQFFVILDNLTELQRLPKNYTIFGQVTEGLDVVQTIGGVPVGMSASGEVSAPTAPVELVSVEIIQTPKG
jgi:cyclophilin family peptidyl-prolyl cis-trans isomerase